MVAVNPPGFLQNAGSTHTAEITRQAFAGSVSGAQGSTSLRPRGGVNPALGNQLRVQQAGSPNMSVDVLSGYAIVPGTEGTKQAAYSCLNDATVNLSISASDPTNGRLDKVILRVQDSFYSGATNSWSIEIVTGTPSGSPALPTSPANSITLAVITVGAGVTSIVNANISDTRLWLVGSGGILPVATQTERDALISSSLYSGLAAWRRDTSALEIRDSSAWLSARLGAWIDFSSAAIISASSGGFVKGSTTYSARYVQIGKLVTYMFTISINTGGGFAAGTGQWRFLLPVTAVTSPVGAGAGRVLDSGSANLVAAGYFQSTTNLEIATHNSVAPLGSGGPGTAWATGDTINFGITYEAA